MWNSVVDQGFQSSANDLWAIEWNLRWLRCSHLQQGSSYAETWICLKLQNCVVKRGFWCSVANANKTLPMFQITWETHCCPEHIHSNYLWCILIYLWFIELTNTKMLKTNVEVWNVYKMHWDDASSWAWLGVAGTGEILGQKVKFHAFYLETRFPLPSLKETNMAELGFSPRRLMHILLNVPCLSCDLLGMGREYLQLW